MLIKKVWTLAIVVILVFCLGRAAFSTEEAKAAVQKLDVPVRKFLAAPVEGSKAVFEFPISVRIIGRTEDKKWYKLRVSYNFFGYVQYEGWVKVE